MLQKIKPMKLIAICISFILVIAFVITTAPIPSQASISIFNNHLGENRPDPFVYKHSDGYYYFLFTAGNRIDIYKSKTLTGINWTNTDYSWSPPAGINNIWAPEINYINNKWYIYFSANSTGNTNDQRIYCLENTNADPLTANWVNKGVMSGGDAMNYRSIDGDVISFNGQLYMAWAAWRTNNVDQYLYIAKLDNNEPWKFTTNRVLLSQPTYDWEKIGMKWVNEAPQFLVRNGYVFVIYSASHCSTDDYCLGQLSVSDTVTDLTTAAWTKKSTPVFSKDPTVNIYGPGHNTFSKSFDNTEDWIIYHANNASGQGCSTERKLMMQKFTWNGDGTPNFGKPKGNQVDMNYPSGENNWFNQYQPEFLILNATSTGDTHSIISGAEASGGERAHFNSNAVNDYVEYLFTVPAAGTYEIWVQNFCGTDKGKYQVIVDGTTLPNTGDQYSSAVTVFTKSYMGTKTFSSSGEKKIRFKVTGKNASSSNYRLGIDAFYMNRIN